MKTLLRAFMLIFFLVLSCHEDIKKSITADDFRIVMPGKYPGFTVPYHETELTKGLRKALDQDILNLIAQRVYPESGDLEYRYMSTRFDEKSQNLIIRYFGKIKEDSVLAGYQIQFVFKNKKDLFLVCVAPVPLE